MQLTAKQSQAQEVVKNIISKCWEDASFAKDLIASPVQTLEKYAGSKFTLPAGKELVVVDQTDTSKLYLNIPAKPSIDDLELTDEQLEMVAGGEFILAGAGLILLGTAVGVGLGILVTNM